MNQDTLEKILGREEHTELIEVASNTFANFYKNKNILVTGGNGSLGNALADWFDAHGINSYHLLDIETENDVKGRRIHQCNILRFEDIRSWVNNSKADFVFHFAAAKHAPVGETDPWGTMQVNIEGTQNIIRALEGFGGKDNKLILSSTCKSIQPETCYGASKLIADRLALNAGHNVVRYYNVVQSSGNVFEIWDKTGAPYFVTPCERFFISLDEAIALTLYGGLADKGRYSIDPGDRRDMKDIVTALYGDDYIQIPPRRGDRVAEPLVGPNETAKQHYGAIFKVVNYNDELPTVELVNYEM